jgi:hypothetical protein
MRKSSKKRKADVDIDGHKHTQTCTHLLCPSFHGLIQEQKYQAKRGRKRKPDFDTEHPLTKRRSGV